LEVFMGQYETSVAALPPVPAWAWWGFAGGVLLLQLVIILILVGRPRAVAVIGVLVPVVAMSAAVAGTGLVLRHHDLVVTSQLYHSHGLNEGVAVSPISETYDEIMPLLYVMWGAAGVLSLAAVVLCVLALWLGPFPRVRPDETTKPATGTEP
jgi:hypothetical protein